MGSKRRRDSDDDDSENVDETGRLVESASKRSRLSEVASAPEEQDSLPPPSPSPSPRETTPEPTIAKDVVDALPATPAVEPKTSGETTDVKDANSVAIAEEDVQKEDNGEVEDECSSAEATSPVAEDEVPSTATEETAPATVVRESSPTPAEQIPVLEDSSISSNTEASEAPITVEAKGTIASEMPPAALNLSTPAPIEVN